MEKSLYERLGGYDTVSAVCNDLMIRLMSDVQLSRFWTHRGDDGLAREKQLMIDYLCAATGGPLYYRGRDMKQTHTGMHISDSDWDRFVDHLEAALEKFNVPAQETQAVLALIERTRGDMVEVRDMVEA